MNDELKGFSEAYVVGRAMEICGGGFCNALGTALLMADQTNVQRIKTAFPEYWDQYLTMGKRLLKDNRL